jgi:hypothetical protein
MKLLKVQQKQKETTIIPCFVCCCPSHTDAQYMGLKFNHTNYGLTEVLDLGAVASAAAAGELLPSD